MEDKEEENLRDGPLRLGPWWWEEQWSLMGEMALVWVWVGIGRNKRASGSIGFTIRPLWT